jgi:hypothetical protein
MAAMDVHAAVGRLSHGQLAVDVAAVRKRHSACVPSLAAAGS